MAADAGVPWRPRAGHRRSLAEAESSAPCKSESSVRQHEVWLLTFFVAGAHLAGQEQPRAHVVEFVAKAGIPDQDFLVVLRQIRDEQACAGCPCFSETWRLNVFLPMPAKPYFTAALTATARWLQLENSGPWPCRNAVYSLMLS